MAMSRTWSLLLAGAVVATGSIGLVASQATRAHAAPATGVMVLAQLDGGDLLGDDSGLLDEGGGDLLADEPLAPEGDALDGGLLGEEQASPEGDLFDFGAGEEETEQAEAEPEGDVHEQLLLENRYPSANTCATCHPKQFREWSVSQHAYAQLSPVFNSMQAEINRRTSGTNGDFCVRCHTQVGMNLGESVYGTNLDRHPTSREGITCVACHRLNRNYGKVSGRFGLVEGDLYDPVYGPRGNQELTRVLSSNEYRVTTKRGEPGRGIHTEVEPFFELTTPGFCGSCHDVTLLDGFRLEEAFAEYKQTPASNEGVSCQDCHMGKVQGADEGYEYGPAAIVGGVPTKDRRVTNHYFAGPDYSIVHPGIFPHNVDAANFKTLQEWLQFDVDAGWGTDEFEDNVADDYEFPAAWQAIDDRYDGRKIIEDQLELLEWSRQKRQQVLEHGIQFGGIKINHTEGGDLEFDVQVNNATTGHGVPTGFDAERLMFLQVNVMDSEGKVLYQSGDRDPNGDVRNLHSTYVHNGELPEDEDLFNLQAKFIVRLVRGGEREQILAVNRSFGPLPYIRPEARPTTLYGRPRLARKHKQNIDPLGHRIAEYEVDADELSDNYPLTVDIKFIAQMVPVNLISEIQKIGFDYGLTPMEVARRVVKGAHLVFHRSYEVDQDGNVVETSNPDQVASLN